MKKKKGFIYESQIAISRRIDRQTKEWESKTLFGIVEEEINDMSPLEISRMMHQHYIKVTGKYEEDKKKQAEEFFKAFKS